MVNWQIEVDKVIKESREGIFNISCEPKPVSAAILRVNQRQGALSDSNFN